MATITIKLGNEADLIIDEPNSASSGDRAIIVTSAIAQAFSDSTSLSPSTRTGFLPITIGSKVFRIYYELRVKRIMNALTAYSEAISHIEQNPHLYDQRLARKAIEVLRECYNDRLG
ncbi:hypothetical protein [Argonema galeatum]|uniref:hypothetical protein n=1 Tax=Argonema galeatum TaxID=2942762 RepID=UPI002010FADB|nr:hypothetical protein [Argonema galeatum]MCL1468016.1 hypothetical protein [Argonema galeatum A003/A1]